MKTCVRLIGRWIVLSGVTAQLLYVSSLAADAGQWTKCILGMGNNWSWSHRLLFAGSVGSQETGYTWQSAWNGSCNSIGSGTWGETYAAKRNAEVGTNGSVTATLTWSPSTQGELPPSQVWIKETSSAVWFVYSGACNVHGSGSLYSSLGGVYTALDYYVGSVHKEKRLELRAERWSRVGSSSGKIVRSARLAATAEGNNDCTLSMCEVSVGCGYDISVHTVPPTLAQRTKIAPQNQRSGAFYPLTPNLNAANGAAPSGGDPVDLATGAHAYLPGPDITAYNPYGPSVVYQRNFLTESARAVSASPGLSIGWVDGYDAKVVPVSPTTWGGLKLTYPNGAQETSTPVLNGGVPTGEFTEPAGATYYVSGVPAGQVGQWQSVTVTWNDQTQWVFLPAESNTYRLSRIANRVGRYIAILRDSGNSYRVSSIADDSNPANTLLTFAYSGVYLSSLTDAYGRKVSYTFGSSAGTTCLLSVSQIAESGTASPPAHHTYGYQAIVDPDFPANPAQPYLVSVSFPSPTGSGLSVQRTNYDTSTLRVSSLVDANGNRHEFTYEYNNGTRVQVENAQGAVQKEFVQNFDPAHSNVNKGTTDAKGNCTALLYEDANNAFKPTKVFDKNGVYTTFTYDLHGNITKAKNARGTETVYTYDYTVFPQGRLTSIQEGSKTPTTFTYHEPSGLVHTITGPRPGATDGSTVTTTFTYDALGNVLTKTSPGNNAATEIVTTYNYTTDGGYTQPAKLGQPLTVTDNLGHITHFRYDLRGNVISAKDALGNESNFTHNIADQPLTVVYPSTSP